MGIADLMEVANAPLKTSYKFEEMYQCDPSKPHYGFKSWDGTSPQPSPPRPPPPTYPSHTDFFTRRLHPASRPVASPDNPLVVTSACESRPYNHTHRALPRDRFWIKSQPYSVLDMLAHHPLSSHFTPTATVYQAFLSALSYHRWHAPVSGVIRAAFVEDGTYFSEPLCEHEEGAGVATTINRAGIATAQGYLTALATRAVIFIEAEAEQIGLMAFVGVGMDEVSTCEITVKEGQRVEKGDEMGMFHFGGSSHCLLFREGVRVKGFPELGGKVNVPVRGRVCVVEA